MVDLLPRVGQSVEAAKLEAALGVKVVPIDGRTGRGAQQLLDAARAAAKRGWEENALAQLPSEPAEGYGRMRRLLEESRSVTQAKLRSRASDPFTERIDRVVLHRILGFPIFFVILVGLFASIFWAARPLMDGVDATFAAAGDLVLRLPGGMFTRFLSEGVI